MLQVAVVPQQNFKIAESNELVAIDYVQNETELENAALQELDNAENEKLQLVLSVYQDRNSESDFSSFDRDSKLNALSITSQNESNGNY
jgi:hypothetical protein